MKAVLALLSVILFAAALPGGDSSVRSAISKTTGWGADRLEFGKRMVISNDHNFYAIDYVQWKADDKSLPRVQYWLFEARMYGGYSRPVFDFFKISVNGIPESKLQPQEKDLTLWNENGMAGCETAMNFDGAKMILRWHMRPDSPLLICSIRPAADSLEPVKNIKINFTMVISGLSKDKDGKVIWNGAYERQAVTPARTITQDKKPIMLNTDDRYLIFQDAKLDGSTQENGTGPSYLTFDTENIVSAKLSMDNAVFTNLEIEIKPDFKEFRFGLWQQKDPISNSSFLEKFNKNKDSFVIDITK